jgi:electron transport complex protein RnfG
MERKNNRTKSSLSERILKNRTYPVIFLVIIVFAAVTVVMVVSNFTMAKILAERDAEIIAQFESIFPDYADYRYQDEFYQIYDSDDQLIGHAFITKGNGYGGEIDILIGIDTDYNIKKISIVSHTETPGLGTKIEESFFTDQFAGLGTEDIELSSDGGEIDAITGATVSSKAVTDAVRTALDEKIESIEAAR